MYESKNCAHAASCSRFSAFKTGRPIITICNFSINKSRRCKYRLQQRGCPPSFCSTPSEYATIACLAFRWGVFKQVDSKSVLSIVICPPKLMLRSMRIRIVIASPLHPDSPHAPICHISELSTHHLKDRWNVSFSAKVFANALQLQIIKINFLAPQRIKLENLQFYGTIMKERNENESVFICSQKKRQSGKTNSGYFRTTARGMCHILWPLCIV